MSGPDFATRRQKAKLEVNQMDRDIVHSQPERTDFFNTVYRRAEGDAARIPWADLKPKDKLIQWLESNKRINLKNTSSKTVKAVDIACGLGDNAAILAGYGFETTGFDLSKEAIDWAARRFQNSNLSFQQADLFALPGEWLGTFDFIHECYTLQALPPQMLEKTTMAIASLAAAGAHLLVYTRWLPDGSKIDGPPWPLEETQLDCFEKLGFTKIQEDRFDLVKEDGRKIPHAFTHWRKK